MALDADRIQKLQDALQAVKDWQERRFTDLDSQAAFLRSVKTPVSSLSQSAHDSAAEDVEAFLESLSISVS